MTEPNKNLLALGFQHNASDNTYSKPIDSQFSLEVDESGKIYIVADAEETGIASMELTEGMVSNFREVMFKVKNKN